MSKFTPNIYVHRMISMLKSGTLHKVYARRYLLVLTYMREDISDKQRESWDEYIFDLRSETFLSDLQCKPKTICAGRVLLDVLQSKQTKCPFTTLIQARLSLIDTPTFIDEIAATYYIIHNELNYAKDHISILRILYSLTPSYVSMNSIVNITLTGNSIYSYLNCIKERIRSNKPFCPFPYVRLPNRAANRIENFIIEYSKNRDYAEISEL